MTFRVLVLIFFFFGSEIRAKVEPSDGPTCLIAKLTRFGAGKFFLGSGQYAKTPSGSDSPQMPKIGSVKGKFEPKRKRRIASERKKIDPQFKKKLHYKLATPNRLATSLPVGDVPAAPDRIMSKKIVIKLSFARQRSKFEGTACQKPFQSNRLIRTFSCLRT
jgi:hypothetical protein